MPRAQTRRELRSGTAKPRGARSPNNPTESTMLDYKTRPHTSASRRRLQSAGNLLSFSKLMRHTQLCTRLQVQDPRQVETRGRPLNSPLINNHIDPTALRIRERITAWAIDRRNTYAPGNTRAFGPPPSKLRKNIVSKR